MKQALITKIKSLLKLIQEPAFLFFGLLFLAGVFFLSPRLNNLSYGNIDPSYDYAVNQAANDGKSFGTDFIATYGPLAYVITNYLPQNVTKVSWWLVLFSILSATIVFAFALQYGKGPNRWLIGIILLYALMINKGGGSVEWNYFMVFVAACFLYPKLPSKYKPWYLVVLSTLAASSLYIKFSFGLGLCLTTVLLALFSAEHSIITRFKRVLIIISTTIGMVWLVGKLLNVDSIGAYLKAGFILAGNFSGAMVQFDPETWPAILGSFIVILFITLWLAFSARKHILNYAFLAPVLFFAWKYSIVRQDGHIISLFQVILPLTFLLYFQKDRPSNRDTIAASVIIIFTIITLWANKTNFYTHTGFLAVATSPVSNITQGKFIQFFKIGQQKHQWKELSKTTSKFAVLPSTITDKIGREGVDIFPWETVVIHENKLKWQNRPSPFSFQNYDPYLDNQNAQFFNSNQASPYVLWHRVGGKGLESIDSRYLLWDEPATFQSLLKNYQFEDSSGDFILLKKRNIPLATRTLTSQMQNSNTEINLPPANGLQSLKFKVHQSFKSKFKKLLFRGKPYFLEYGLAEDGHLYRFVQENSIQGLVITLPLDWEQLKSLLADPNNYKTPAKTIFVHAHISNIELQSHNYE